MFIMHVCVVAHFPSSVKISGSMCGRAQTRAIYRALSTMQVWWLLLMLLDKIEEGRLTISLTVSLNIICMECGACYAWC